MLGKLLQLVGACCGWNAAKFVRRRRWRRWELVSTKIHVGELLPVRIAACALEAALAQVGTQC